MAKDYRRFRVIPAEEGQTLAILLSRRLPKTSRKEATRIIKAGGVYVNKLRVRIPSVRVVAGERITAYPGASEIDELEPESLVFVHRDPSFVVLDKPHGVAVAQTRQSARGTLASALREKLAEEGLVRPYVGVVHRLDLGASGLVLFTIRDIANKSFHRQFVDHQIDRRYRLLVHGEAPESFSCDAALRIVEGQRVRVAEPGDEGSKRARTVFTRLGAPIDGCSLLEAQLETGRTHQIRAHAAHMDFPIVGDRRYGLEKDEGKRLHLHASSLEFAHPLTSEHLRIEAPLPQWARPRASQT
jgi:RluA family pseudouridine synthase